MAKVPYPRGTNGSVGLYYKYQSLLVNSSKKKKPMLGKIKSKIAQKGKAAQKLVKKLLKASW